MKNIESQAAFFEMEGMSMDRTISWLNTPQGSNSIISGTYITGNPKIKVPVHSKKRISDTVVGVVVLFVLSPFLIIVSALVFASSIRSVVLNQEQRS
ncbi:MAG: hypothetical protein JW830_13550 [Bacteroidales bacterium]|nr:hypothetical protein [Bacteroidales bacterium]